MTWAGRVRRACTAAQAVGIAVAVAIAIVLAGLPSELAAQVDTTRRTPPRDTVRVAVPVPTRDSAADSASLAQRRAAERARQDSLAQAVQGDTVKAPLARFEMPDDFELSDRLRFSREQILATGAENLTDILDRVPGVTTYRSGWMAGLHAASYQGDGSRIRLFLDGVELDPIAARNRGTEDLTDISLWPLDELVIERAPGEIRVWMRTWAPRKTIPYTRVDIFTGDLNTNAFRGQFSRRWRNGLLLQLGGQQIATQTGRASAFTNQELTRGRSDGTVQGLLFRTGWSRGRWSVDAFANAVQRDRDAHRARTDFVNLPAYKGQRREAYGRIGYGDTLKGFWSQVVVHALRTTLDNRDSTIIDKGDTTRLETDTIRGRTQQLAAVGYRTDRWHVSLTDRMRLDAGERRHAPALRMGATFGMLEAGAWSEQAGRDSTDRTDLFVRVKPTDWLRVTGAYSTRTPDDTTGRLRSTSSRLEGAIRLRRLWLGGGIVRDDATTYDNIQLIGLPSAPLASAPAQGVLGSVNGVLYKALRFDLQAIRWNTGQYSRPRTQVHAELALISDWRSRFPKGEFSINTRLIYDRRDGVPMYYLDGNTVDQQVTETAQVVTGLLEIRIQQATLFYQYRNLTGGAYEQIRGITMPPGVQLYGVRWNFFN